MQPEQSRSRDGEKMVRVPGTHHYNSRRESAEGRGHFVGVAKAVLQAQNGWFGEGEDMIFIDDDTMPTINETDGTATEGQYNSAWDFGLQSFTNMHQGEPYVVDSERIGGRYCLYWWHVESPITFEKSIKVTIEHGHANHRSDNFYSVRYWHQTELHAASPKLPAAKNRIPKILDPGGGAAPASCLKNER